MRTSGRVLMVVGLVLSGLLVAATPAAAHNALTGSDPQDGASVDAPPRQVELRFLASLDPANSELAVTGPEGDSVLAGDPVFDGSQVTIPVATTVAGDYEIAYGVLSRDGHFVEGTVEFTLTEGDPPAPTTAPSPTPVAGASEPPITASAPVATEPPLADASASGSGSGMVWLGGAVLFALVAGTGWAIWRWRRRPAAG